VKYAKEILLVTALIAAFAGVWWWTHPSDARIRRDVRAKLVASNAGGVRGADFDRFGPRVVPAAIALLQDVEVSHAANQLLVRCAGGLSVPAPPSSTNEHTTVEAKNERLARRPGDWAGWYAMHQERIDPVKEFTCFPDSSPPPDNVRIQESTRPIPK
jgi:hypothetical protein